MAATKKGAAYKNKQLREDQRRGSERRSRTRRGIRRRAEGDRSEMGKTPVRMKAVIYALSPFQQKVMSGLWKDIPHKIEKKVSENWIGATLLLTPLVGTYS
ncbi:Cytochrome b-c1 complex subunit 8 [Nymphaea thermarum]|nr:Cytochrome b-c1 complex subunit 8 [Nymphaea thermarum]